MEGGGVGGDCFPCGDMPGGDDKPELAVLHRAGGIGDRWPGGGVWMAVVMAQDTAILGADVAVGGEEDGGIDLEVAGRVRGGVAGRDMGLDMAGGAGEQAAAFGGMRGGGFGLEGFDYPACNSDDHPDMP